MRIIPDINVGAIHKPLLNVLKELVDHCLECGEVLRVGGAMVAEHLGAENSCELTQGLEVVEMNHQGPEGVVQDLTEALEKRPEGFRRVVGRNEELIEEGVFILAHMEKESAAGADKTTVVSPIFYRQIGDCRTYGRQQQLGPAREVRPLYVRQRRLVFLQS